MTALKKIESRLKDRFEAVRKTKPDLAKGGDFMKALKDVKDPTFTPEERRVDHRRDNARKLTEMALRYRPIAYSVSDVVPPQVPSLADTTFWREATLDGRMWAHSG